MSGTTIQSFSVRFLSIPLERELVTSTFSLPAIDTALIEIRTKDGHSGVGWCFSLRRGVVASLVRLLEDLGSLAIGRDALATESLWSTLMSAVAFAGKRGLAASAIAAVDMACWDIVGKASGLPVYKLLGGHNPEVKTYASQGLWLDRSIGDLAQEASTLVEQGFSALKMRVGLPVENDDIERVRAVRDAVGPNIDLMVDVNQGWDLKQTLRMAGRLEPYDLFWIEEPMPIERVQDYAHAVERLTVPISTGESNYLKQEVLAIAENRAADHIMLDLMRMGGVTEWRKAAHVCEAFGLTVSPHLFMEHSSHLAASCPNAIWQEYMPWWQPIMENPMGLRDGTITLTDVSGFGIELSKHAMKAYEIH